MFSAKKYIIFIFTLFLSIISLAQDKGKIVNSHGVGECVLDDNMTPNQAKAQAIQAAKIDAIMKKCPQDITIYDIMVNGTQGEYFDSHASIVTRGSIIEIKNEKITTETRNNKTVYKCAIDVKILITTVKPDALYKATAEADKTMCFEYDGPNRIDVNVSKDSYIKMFYLKNRTLDDAIMIHEDFVKANKKTNIISGEKLTLEIDNGGNSEIFYFAVAFTKEDIPYNEGTDFDIWYNSIPNDMKTISFFIIEVRKRNN